MDHQLVWRTSTRSSGGGDCVEVADLPVGGCAVRDSKDPGGTRLEVTGPAWEAFTRAVKADELS